MSTLNDLFGAGGVAGFLGKVADKIWPDPLERAKQQVRLIELQQAGEFKEIDAALQAAQMQADINVEEAKNNNLFVSGWRPFIGWVCGSACVWNWIGMSFVKMIAVSVGANAVTIASLAPANLDEMLPVLIGMLGLSGLRTYEKFKGVAAT